MFHPREGHFWHVASLTRQAFANYRRLSRWTVRDETLAVRLSRRRGFGVFFLTAFAVAVFAIGLDPHTPAITRTFPSFVEDASHLFTRFGKSDWILIPSGTLLLAMFFINWPAIGLHRRAFWIRFQISVAFVFLSVAGSGIIVAILKRFVGRARPSHFAVDGAYFFHPFANASYASFPSGHATTIAAFATAIAMLRPRLAMPVFVLAMLVAFSRVAIGAHYPSDVIAGLSFGASFTVAVADWMSRRCLTTSQRDQLWLFIPRPVRQHRRFRTILYCPVENDWFPSPLMSSA